jgi:Ca-activated chloride channel family protein
MILRFILIAVLLVLQLTSISFPQTFKYSVVSGEVPVYVLVTEKNKPVTNLNPDDFQVFDNGVPQEIVSVTPQNQTPITVTLVFDLSFSVAGRLFNELKIAASTFLADLGKEDHVALITFNNAVALGCFPTQNHSDVRLALERIQPSGRSSLIDASFAGLLLAQSRRDPRLLIIFSDGQDTSSWLTPEAVLETAEHNDAVVYAVSKVHLPDKSFLGKLARNSGGRQVELIPDLTFAFLSILREFRQSYQLSYRPRGVTDGGWHNLEVRVNRPHTTVRSRPGYMRNAASE